MKNEHKITARLDDKHHAMLTNLCDNLKMSQNDFIEYAIEKETEKDKQIPILFTVNNNQLTKINNYIKKHGATRNQLLSMMLDNLTL